MTGPFCDITGRDHDTESGLKINRQLLRSSAEHIEDYAWIGAHVSILKGVTIGFAAIVGTGRIFANDVVTNTFVAGIPANFIGQRSL